MAAAIRQVLDRSGLHPEAVGLSGQMHGLVLLGDRGLILRPAMLWNDGRAFRQCDVIRDQLGVENLVALTGNNAFAGFTAPKLLWVRDAEPDVYARAAHVLLPKDYIRYRLTGVFATDKAGAGGTLLLDLKRRTWAEHLPPEAEYPVVLASTHV